MPELKDILNHRVGTLSAGGTYDDLDGERIPDGHFAEITHVTIENQTTAYTRLVIGIADSLDFYEMEEDDSPAADDLHWSKSPIIVPPRMFFRARLTGCTAADVLRMTYQGKLYKIGG